MKKQLLTAVALIATISELSAGLLSNTLDTGRNLTSDVLHAPADVVNGPDRRTVKRAEPASMAQEERFDYTYEAFNPRIRNPEL
ncbi:MAG: hypothetical protein K2X90_03375 [Candidatus Babeliaceae bacterium]|nr:hypothetical protein [Candidatus Babeliaceae bacterium]